MSRGLLLALGGAALVVAAFVLALLDPSALHAQPEPSPWPSVLAGLGGLALLAAAFLERRSLRRALVTRQARFGAFAAAYVAAVVLGLAALAFLVERQGWRLDLTRDRTASLEADTLRVLRSIPPDGPPVEIFGFVAGGGLQPIDTKAAVAELGPLFQLVERSSPRVETSFVDATRDPSLTRALGIARLPSLAVRVQPDEGEARIVRTDVLNERELARAVEEALLGRLSPVHVVQGHGEMSASDMEGSGGLFAALMSIAADNYDLRPLDLAQAGGVPDDAELLILAGPQSDYLAMETASLKAFVERGGRVLLLAGPVFDSGGRVASMPVLSGWLREQLGVELRDAVACDLEGLSGPGADLRTLLVSPAANAAHPILRGRDRFLVLPFARPVERSAELPHGSRTVVLLRSGNRSWAEADTPARPAFDPKDARGPHPLALAVEFAPHGQERAGRLVVAGSHLFASNAFVPLAGNSSFLLDSIAWLGEREAVLEARTDRGRDGTAVIAERQGDLIRACAAGVPLILVVFGAVTWWHRRRL